eukprot:c18795_g1_i1.p1 GENE.c18795_g1_i1~~c18795_g1_i1.p1  ORF type:complete len:455 (+),score=145.61 c18795_g1_i1:122-1486(+)
MSSNELITEEQQISIRYCLSALGTKAIQFYSNTKERTPTRVKGYIDTVEHRLVSPCIEPIKTQWKRLGDPVITVLDSCITETIIPQTKYIESSLTSKVSQVQENLIKPSKEYITNSVDKVQKKIVATEEYIYASKAAASDFVRQGIVIKSGEYVQDTKHQIHSFAQKKKEEIKDRSYRLLHRVIDNYLPEENDENEGNVDVYLFQCTNSQVGKKLSFRLQKRAKRLYVFGQEKVNKILFVDFVGYAKETIGVDEEKLTKLFDRVIAVIPDSDYSNKLSNSIIHYCPVFLQPILEKGFITILPVINFTSSSLTRSIFAVRNVIVGNKIIKTNHQIIGDDEESTEDFETEVNNSRSDNFEKTGSDEFESVANRLAQREKSNNVISSNKVDYDDYDGQERVENNEPPKVLQTNEILHQSNKQNDINTLADSTPVNEKQSITKNKKEKNQKKSTGKSQ